MNYELSEFARKIGHIMNFSDFMGGKVLIKYLWCGYYVHNVSTHTSKLIVLKGY